MTADTDMETDDGTGGEPTLEAASLAADDGGTGRTSVFDGDPRAVSLSLAAGESVPRHEHPGETVLLLIRTGEASVTVGGTERTLSAGEVVRFDGGDGVGIDARTDVSALVVLTAGGEP